MLKTGRTIVALLIASAAFCLAWQCQDRAASSQVATRYHLRNRTEQFFDRAAVPAPCPAKQATPQSAPAKEIKKCPTEKPRVATHYRLRNRTEQFFERAVA